MKKKRIILLIAILAMVILLYNYSNKTETKTKETIEPIETIEDPSISDIKEDDGTTKFGDLLEINFVLKVKETGEVIDTNNLELIEQYNIKNYVKGPYRFILGNSDKLKKKSFDKALVGWKLGDKKTVEIAPTEEELYIKKDRIEERNIYFSILRHQRLPLKNFEELFGKEAKIGEIVENKNFPWSFLITNITEKNAVGDPVLKIGNKYNIPDVSWPVELIGIEERVIQFKHSPDKPTFESTFGTSNITIKDNKVIIYHNPIQGNEIDYDISLGPVLIPAKFEILDVTEKDFLLYRIDNINDKHLILEAEILSITPSVKTVSEDSLDDKITQRIF
jgi:hypothetical protein